MKTSLYLIIYIFLLPVAAFAQWEKIGPLPIQEYLSNAVFITPEIAFVGANNGIIYKTYDDFKTYRKLNTGFQGTVDYFEFLNSSEGYIVQARKLLKTTDGGQSWSSVLSVGPDETLYVSFITPDSGWAIKNRQLLFTSNGGTSWSVRKGSFPARRIEFLNGYKGFAIRTGGEVVETTDGGINWTGIGEPNWFYEISFNDSLEGMVLGKDHNNDVVILLTSDGGNNWVHKQPPINIYTDNFNWCLEDSTIIIAKYDEGIRSDDLGTTWEEFTLESYNHDCWNGNGYYYMKDKYYHFGYGGVLQKTTDKGITWTHLGSKNGGKKVMFVDSLYGFTAPWHYTTDGGNVWHFRDDIWDCDIRDYHFVNRTDGIMVKVPDLLYRTSDGGETWFSDGITGYYFIEFFFVDSLYGWMSLFNFDGWNQGVRKTTDGGKTWLNYVPISYVEIPTIYFINRSTGFFYGREGNGYRGFRTTDGGETWSNNLFSKGEYIQFFKQDSQYVGYSENWLTGDNPGLVRSFDEGATYDYVDPSFSSISFFFKDTSVGWYADFSDIYITSDGGVTWNVESHHPQVKLTSWYMNGSVLFAAGDYGTLYRRSPLITEIDQADRMPETFLLQQNYPNPFNPSTTISYSIPEAGRVRLIVYDVLGRETARLVDEEKPAGSYTAKFNAASHASGIYYYTITSGEFRQTRKMTLIK